MPPTARDTASRDMDFHHRRDLAAFIPLPPGFISGRHILESSAIFFRAMASTRRRHFAIHFSANTFCTEKAIDALR